MKLWIVEYVAGARGCPVVLKGTLNKPWVWDEWSTTPARDVPTDYVYTARHPVLDFDFWDLNRLASDRFVGICNDFELHVQPIPVELIQSGEKKSTKDYFYLNWLEWASIIDTRASTYEVDTVVETNAPAFHLHVPDAPVLLSVESFVVDPAKVPPAAAFKCLDFDSKLVCTDEFRRACEDAGLLGVEFTDASHYTKADFWG